MLKKITTILLVLIVGLGFSSVDALAEGGRGGKTHPDRIDNKVTIVGEVVEVNQEGFQVLNSSGVIFTIDEPGALSYRWSPTGDASFQEIHVGMWVNIAYLKDAVLGWVPTQIVLIGDYVDPGGNETVQFSGVVSAVDRNDALFDVLVGQGQDLKAFQVDQETLFKGGLSQFGDLAANQQVTILAAPDPNGGLRAISIKSAVPQDAVDSQNDTTAASASSGTTSTTTTTTTTTTASSSSTTQNIEPKHTEGGHTSGEYSGEEGGNTNPNNTGDDGDYYAEIYNGNPKLNAVGRVTAVGPDSLTIQTSDGTPKTFSVDEKTLWNSYWAEQDSLAEVHVNYKVSVIYIEGDTYNGLQRAYRLAILNGGTAFNPHQQGWVQSVSADEMTIETNQGAVYTFEIESYTSVKGVSSVSDIAPGMKVFVYYKDMGTELCAVGIQVWP